MRVYTYKNCDTCRRAVKFLTAHGISFQDIPIRDVPPTKAELKKMLSAQDGQMKKLFNTSGRDYRDMKLGEKLSEMSENEALSLLESNGNLVKRPFLVGPSVFLVGFQEDVWREKLDL